jgi:hypothetical protein
MATQSGIYSIKDLLEVRNASAAQFGIDHIQATLASETAWTNQSVNELLADLVQPTVNQSEIWGSAVAVSADEVDELGGSLPKKQLPGITASVPLRRFTQRLGWSQKYFELKSPNQLASEYLALRKGYLLEIQKQIKKAIYNNVNYSYVDSLYNGVTLSVKQFCNADGGYTLPDSPGGATFTSASHDHYAGEASFAPGFVDSLISNVTEHGGNNTRGVKLVCALADVTTVTSASAGFTSLPDANIQTLTTQLVSGRTADFSDLENRLLGFWTGGVEVWVKPWAIANYIVCYASGANPKPLLYRQRPQSSLQGWRIASPYNDYPLIAQNAEFELGFAAFKRDSLAVLYFSNATWANPTIT